MAYLTAPAPFAVVFALLGLSTLAAFCHPPSGVYLVVFLSLVGDDQTIPWWPFTANLSERDSIFFVSDGISINPFEIVLVAAYAGFLTRSVADPAWRFHRGRLVRPVVAFGVFVMLGLFRGLGTGGDVRIALLEVRPLLYLVGVYLLIPAVLRSASQYRWLFAVALAGVSLQSMVALSYYQNLPAIERELLESLAEHTASVTMNVIFLFTIGLFAFRGTGWKRWAMVAVSVPVVWAYLLSQRRAGMVALFAGLIVLGAVLFVRRRDLFVRVMPSIVVCALLFILATWNARGAIGLPSTAVKTVLFPDSLTNEDVDSNLYRDLENYNLWFTISTNRLFGRGFGQPFLIARPMPDISFFEFWQYIPHNAFLWMWIKTGFFGFVSMLYLFGRTIANGARTAVRVRSSDDAAMVTACLAYAVMFLVFSYVDITWGIRPAVFLAVCLAVCSDFFEIERRELRPTIRSLVHTPAQVPLRALA